MTTIITCGCFDVFHEGHERFLRAAKQLGISPSMSAAAAQLGIAPSAARNKLLIAVNSDLSAKKLKACKWGERYPIDDHLTRMANVSKYADITVGFDTEEQLHALIEHYAPCILVKGPDYAGTSVTGDDIAPVLILDTPEPESVKEMKLRVYGAAASIERRCCNPEHVEPSTDRKNVLRGKGPTAINAAKDRCPKGHPYSGRKWQQGGWVRICKTCRYESETKRRRKNRAKSLPSIREKGG